MDIKACFIRDRAFTLVCDVKVHPMSTDSALAWVRLAISWAKKRNLTELTESLEAAKASIV